MKITVIIPCHNEAKSVAKVIKGFPVKKLQHHGLVLDILVIDNCSTDNTAARATKAGARVIKEPARGKGHAIKTGFANISEDADYVVMIDGDNSYRSNEILRMIEPLENNFCDVVMGSRLAGKLHQGAMGYSNRAGNWVYTHLVRFVYMANITDALTGYFAWKREVVDSLSTHLRSSGFAIEMEMITKMANMHYRIYSVPITYQPRIGHSKLRPVHDGLRILKIFTKNMLWEHSNVNKVDEE